MHDLVNDCLSGVDIKMKNQEEHFVLSPKRKRKKLSKELSQIVLGAVFLSKRIRTFAKKTWQKCNRTKQTICISSKKAFS